MPRLRAILFVAVISVLVMAAPKPPQSAQAALHIPSLNALDPDFKPVFASPGTVKGIIPLPAAKMLIYGSFTTISGAPRNNIAILNADGSVDSAFNLATELSESSAYMTIEAAALVSGGKILIGGFMERITPDHWQMYLFRLNPDGSIDSSFDAGGFDINTNQLYGLNGKVTALHVDNNGYILVGGDFTAPHNHITRLNPDGSPDPSFDPGSGADGPVQHIDMQTTGQILIAGAFTTVDGSSTRGVARLDANGGLDAAFFGAGISGYSTGGLDPVASALLVTPDDSVLVGGAFANIKGQSAPTLARLNASGGLDATFQPSVRGYFEEVTSLLIVDNLLVAGGWNPIMYFDAKPMDHDARIYLMQAASGAFANYESFEGKPTDVWALARRTDGKVMAGGSFIKEDNIDNSDYFPGLYLFTPPNFGTDQAFKPIVGGQANLSSLAVQDDGKILAAGEFYRANGLLFNGLARLSIDGSLDLAFTPADYPTYRINLRPDQKIIASGRYGVNGQDNSDLALLNPDGSVGSRGIAGNVTSLVAQPDLKVVLTSNWSPGVSRFNSDLTPDTVFSSNRGSGITNFQSPDLEFDRVNTSVLQGTNIIAGGSFSTFSGITVHNLVRLKSDGKFDNSFVLLPFTVFNFRSEVFALAVQPDNKVLVGGRFSTVGGVSDPSLVRLNPDGSLDTSFHSPFADAGATVYALALQPDGKILVGGTIQFVEGSNVYNSFVRLNADGSRDTTFNASVHGAVHTLAFETPNAVLLGGSFDAVDGQPRQGLARYIVTLLLPTVDSNYLNGAPGSFFTLHATNFAPGADLTISVNNHDLGDVQADTAGAVSFVLDATQADPGPYICRLRTKGTLGVYATQAVESAQILIDVRTGYPVRSKEAGPDVFGIPAGIAGSSVYLPVMIR